MAVVIIKSRVTEKDKELASEEYGEYIKVVADIVTGIIAIGGEWHADAEKILLEAGSKQDNLWGGGVNLIKNSVETFALVNIKPRLGNDSQDILDRGKREKFIEIVKEKFGL